MVGIQTSSNLRQGICSHQLEYKLQSLNNLINLRFSDKNFSIASILLQQTTRQRCLNCYQFFQKYLLGFKFRNKKLYGQFPQGNFIIKSSNRREFDQIFLNCTLKKASQKFKRDNLDPCNEQEINKTKAIIQNKQRQ
ncbi:unnamed protein product [Paramecium octaurelia]|uniref:Uncharacterized protein n=1 Tax=Paramecium octaurelia TaxID=43137 RepID=A0A8S1Y7T7_PAROT|nr:unnamed protein product [Paramecium octaurelia]CAD8209248.1 unnamed protein product [Paramecium octaurelia]